MTIQIGVGDSFAYNKEHWIVTDVKGNVLICRNKKSGAIVEFDKEDIRKLIK